MFLRSIFVSNVQSVVASETLHVFFVSTDLVDLARNQSHWSRIPRHLPSDLCDFVINIIIF